MRKASGAPTDRSVRIGLGQLGHDLVGGVPEVVQLVGIECITDGNEPVAMEQGRRSLDLIRGDHVETGDAVAFNKPLPERRDVRVVVGPLPVGAARVACHQISVLGCRFDLDLTNRRRQPERIVVRAVLARRSAIGNPIRRYRRVPSNHSVNPLLGRCPPDQDHTIGTGHGSGVAGPGAANTLLGGGVSTSWTS